MHVAADCALFAPDPEDVGVARIEALDAGLLVPRRKRRHQVFRKIQPVESYETPDVSVYDGVRADRHREPLSEQHRHLPDRARTGRNRRLRASLVTGPNAFRVRSGSWLSSRPGAGVVRI